MSEGVKELKEALVGVQELALVLVPILKDGVQVSDAPALWAALGSNEELKQKLFAAWEGVSKVPDEAKDLDMAEAMELVALEVSYLPKFLALFKA